MFLWQYFQYIWLAIYFQVCDAVDLSEIPEKKQLLPHVSMTKQLIFFSDDQFDRFF